MADHLCSLFIYKTHVRTFEQSRAKAFQQDYSISLRDSLIQTKDLQKWKALI